MARFLATLLIVLLLGMGLGGCSSSSGIKLDGAVEADILSHYSEVSGKILEMPVELGQAVKKGDLLAVLDDSNERKALEQLEATLAIKKASLNELTAAAEEEAIKSAQNNITIAEASYEKAKQNYDYLLNEKEKFAKLYEGGAAPFSEVEKIDLQFALAERELDATAAQIDNARQHLSSLYKGATKEKIAVLQAEIKLTEVQINQIQDDLIKYKIEALADGTVISKNYTAGDVVAMGYNLADITDESNCYLLSYLPDENLYLINYGQELTVQTKKQSYTGVVTYIGLQAQYTPKELQNSFNKNKKSVKIKVRLVEPLNLKPGEKAELIMPKK